MKTTNPARMAELRQRARAWRTEMYRTVRDDNEPAEWCWSTERERPEPLQAEDPGWFRPLLSLAGLLAVAAVTWGAVVVVELVAGRR